METLSHGKKKKTSPSKSCQTMWQIVLWSEATKIELVIILEQMFGTKTRQLIAQRAPHPWGSMMVAASHSIAGTQVRVNHGSTY